MISPGLVFVQKAFAGLIFREAYFQRGLLSEGVLHFKMGLAYQTAKNIKDNSLKQLTVTIYGLIFGRAFYWKDFYI